MPHTNSRVQNRRTGANPGQWATQPLLAPPARRRRARSGAAPQAVPASELAEALQTAVDAAAAYAGPLEPAVSLVGGDLVDLVELRPSAPGIARLAVSGLRRRRARGAAGGGRSWVRRAPPGAAVLREGHPALATPG